MSLTPCTATASGIAYASHSYPLPSCLVEGTTYLCPSSDTTETALISQGPTPPQKPRAEPANEPAPSDLTAAKSSAARPIPESTNEPPLV